MVKATEEEEAEILLGMGFVHAGHFIPTCWMRNDAEK